MKIVQVSDMHISHFGGVTNENLERVAEYTNEALHPDLVIATGDISMLTPDIPEDREAAKRIFELFDAPVRFVPGNHDMGEAGESAWQGIRVTGERHAGFGRTFGSDRFLELAGEHWALVGVNSEIFCSGLDAEADQWAWLDSVAEEVAGRNVAIFLHKPFWFPLEVAGEATTVDAFSRDRLLGLFGGSSVRLVASGHLHCYRAEREAGVLTVWCPSTGYLLPDELPWAAIDGAELQLGVVEYELDGDEISAQLRTVPGLVEADVFGGGIAAFTETMAIVEATSGDR